MGNTCYWEKCPPDPDDEWVGRLVKNAFDAEETVLLMVRDWKHFDWLAAQGVDMDLWTKNADIDRHRPEYRMSLEGELHVSLRLDEERRYLAGKPCPLFIEPEGYEGKIEPEEIPDRLKTDNDWFERQFKNLLGVEVPVSMQGKHWRYFDWLVEKGGNMEKWVIDADFECRARKRTLSEEMMGGLRRHERKYFLNGNDFHGHKLPLFISPSGYLNLDLRTEGKEGVERTLVDSKGETVSLPMPKNFWKYFDWLARQGIDMEQWVADADISRDKGKCVYTLRSELMVGLMEDEKRRFKSDEPCPLIINPNGYDL